MPEKEKEEEKEDQKNKSHRGEIEEKLKECQKLRDEYLAGWQRAKADFLNYKAEEMKRVSEIVEFANEGLILKILPILDSFERAEKEIPDEKRGDKFLKGLLQIKNQILSLLKNEGVEEIDVVGKRFDPNFQEAVAEVETSDVKPGVVIEEIQKGYKLKGRLIRPAKVKVAK